MNAEPVLNENAESLIEFSANIFSVKPSKLIQVCDLPYKYSSLQKLLRVTAYIFRFVDKLLFKHD